MEGTRYCQKCYLLQKEQNRERLRQTAVDAGKCTNYWRCTNPVAVHGGLCTECFKSLDRVRKVTDHKSPKKTSLTSEKPATQTKVTEVKAAQTTPKHKKPQRVSAPWSRLPTSGSARSARSGTRCPITIEDLDCAYKNIYKIGPKLSLCSREMEILWMGYPKI